MGTYQDLLKNPFDEELFEHFATSRIVVVNSVTGDVRSVGDPGIYANAEFSPDGKYLLVTRTKRPFSYRVPFYYFARTTEVWDTKGKTGRGDRGPAGVRRGSNAGGTGGPAGR